MASLRYRNGKWQVQVRRYGHTPRAKSFQSKADAQRWARQIEAELDRTMIPNDVRALNTITVAEVLNRYRDTITDEKRGRIAARKPTIYINFSNIIRVTIFLHYPCAEILRLLNAMGDEEREENIVSEIN